MSLSVDPLPYRYGAPDIDIWLWKSGYRLKKRKRTDLQSWHREAMR